jgi:hypothetical protein
MFIPFSGELRFSTRVRVSGVLARGVPNYPIPEEIGIPANERYKFLRIQFQ